LAGLGSRGCGKSCVARRDLGAADELGEVVDVGEAEVIGNVGFPGVVEDFRFLLLGLAIGDIVYAVAVIVGRLRV
jgi:hypothetical protein